MSAIDRLNRPVNLEITSGELVLLIAALRGMAAGQPDNQDDKPDTEQPIQTLLIKLETADRLPAAGGSVAASNASEELQDHEGTDHNFAVERLLPTGDWVRGWNAATAQTVGWRAVCTCGWRGQNITGDCESGREDDRSREAAFEVWDQFHVPRS